ncbi:hypothetical protein [Dethiosulfatarculus sandiegensis]|uniref:hypothetical protein n=1 Tax=Dethiosulfatarculus sandiegensis TaxID=1429043 RepID=UPI0012E127EF|nr:hypothetical protein [Dethiosulfatarculus sandiegensis]
MLGRLFKPILCRPAVVIKKPLAFDLAIASMRLSSFSAPVPYSRRIMPQVLFVYTRERRPQSDRGTLYAPDGRKNGIDSGQAFRGGDRALDGSAGINLDAERGFEAEAEIFTLSCGDPNRGLPCELQILNQLLAGFGNPFY